MEWILIIGVCLIIGAWLFRSSPQENYAPAPAPAIAIDTPLIPNFPAGTAYEILSLTSTGVTYRVNFAAVSCACADFQHERTRNLPRSLPRLCKHLRQALLAHHRNALEDGIVALLEDEYFSGFQWVHAESIGDDHVYFAATCTPWVNIFARERTRSRKKPPPKGAYHRFGYSTAEKRWSYGETPPAAAAIKAVISRILV